MAGTPSSVKARKEGSLQVNRQQKTDPRSITPRSTKRTISSESSDSGAAFRAEQTDTPRGLERFLGEWDKKPQCVGLANTVSLQARGERSTARDKEAEGRCVQVAEPVQRHAGTDGENGGEEEGVLQVEEVCF